jgi:aspartokinase-like uncharacterized kinase
MVMKNNTSLFKIGGKILEDLKALKSTMSQLTQLLEKGILQRIIIIPGGGTFANFIRKIYSELKFNDELAHWMSIISMNYNGIELSKKYPNLKVIENFRELKKKEEGFYIFLPYQFLKENDVLPHNWEVTSDSIALFLAGKLGLSECFLIKDVEGIMDKEKSVIREISTTEFRKLKKSGKLLGVKTIGDKLKDQSRPIDSYLLSLIERLKISCVILSGSSNSQRIIDFFDKSKSVQEKIFSRII